MEAPGRVKESSLVLRLELHRRKYRWRSTSYQMLAESPLAYTNACTLPYTNEILFFQNRSISFTISVFKEEYFDFTQFLFFDENLNGFLTPEETEKLVAEGSRKYNQAGIMKWVIKKERRVAELNGI